MLYEKTLRKIIICPTCKGKCILKVGNLREMHNHDTAPCPDCGANGMIQRIVNIKYERI